jgi:hypothetical protein
MKIICDVMFDWNFFNIQIPFKILFKLFDILGQVIILASVSKIFLSFGTSPILIKVFLNNYNMKFKQ